MNLVTTDSYSPQHHPLNYPLHKDWLPLFTQLSNKQWFNHLLQEITNAYESRTIAPKENALWRLFEITPLYKLKGIILGQDPYPNLDYANGLAFSVDPGLTIPASLRSIFFELKRSHDIPVSSHGDLSSWAQQGILLLNTALILDMETKKPPQQIDNELWIKLTQSIITFVLQSKPQQPLFMLTMGRKAQKSAKAFLLADHLTIINTPHPSPLAAIGLKAKPFIGCGCFETIDAFLADHGQESITWDLDAPV